MTPAYFPFTCISPAAAAVLAACFKRITVYQPLDAQIPDALRAQAESGLLDMRTPVTADGEKLKALIRDYRAWAEIHQGSPLPFLKTRPATPFFDDFSAHQIRSDIRKKDAGQETAPEAPDLLFNARLFLSITREFDMQQWELADGLTALADMEKKLLQDLRGEIITDDIGLGGQPATAKEDTGAHMTAERLTAWAHLALCDPALSDRFVTDSRAVFEIITEQFPDTETVLRSVAVPPASPQWQAALAACLDQAGEAADLATPDGGQPVAALTVIRVPQPPRAFLNALTGQKKPDRAAGHTLVVCLEG
ncbi:hypothetical protein DENIS_0268 [Desulfonema ishimotonii]|uniref:Uncharacterized protein n=1 Tax=Desulfonema ishimotonii TaxID=45657 RepID=A0A401FQT9_9BACT|nr:hypothetical protein [Desulfonema ishimotonii]GBC59329.1 hypothetical protein DENIS_0268 [Desulfonema ishimotonii]